MLLLADFAGLLAKRSGVVLLSGQNVQPICEEQRQSQTAILHNQEDSQHEGHLFVADVQGVSFSQRVDGDDDGHFDEQIRQHEEQEQILLDFPQFLSDAHEQQDQQQNRNHSQQGQIADGRQFTEELRHEPVAGAEQATLRRRNQHWNSVLRIQFVILGLVESVECFGSVEAVVEDCVGGGDVGEFAVVADLERSGRGDSVAELDLGLLSELDFDTETIPY